MAVVIPGYRIVSDFCVAEAEFIVFLDDASAVVGEVGLDKLLLFEEIEQIAVFIRLLHCALHPVVGQHFIAIDIDFVDLDLIVSVDGDCDDFLIFLAQVGLLQY